MTAKTVTPAVEINEGERLYLLSALVETEADFDKLVAFMKATDVTIKKTENLGSRPLFVKINKHSSLLLTSIFFTSEPATANQLQETLKHEENVARFLLTTWRGPLDAPVRSRRYSKDSKDKVEVEGERAHV